MEIINALGSRQGLWNAYNQTIDINLEYSNHVKYTKNTPHTRTFDYVKLVSWSNDCRLFWIFN